MAKNKFDKNWQYFDVLPDGSLKPVERFCSFNKGIAQRTWIGNYSYSCNCDYEVCPMRQYFKENPRGNGF